MALTSATNDHDADLLRRVGRRDQEALAEIVHAHWRPLVTRLNGLVPDQAVAEDIVQETFVRFWRRESVWTPTAPIGVILFHIARNLALNERSATRVRVDALPRLRLLRETPSTPLDELEHDELQAAVDLAISKLPARRREVFRLVRFDGRSYLEVATIMGTSPQTVANQMSAALTALRRALAPFIDS
jgi:RNA polymerase sigma-70 factor (ECF subfamily)